MPTLAYYAVDGWAGFSERFDHEDRREIEIAFASRVTSCAEANGLALASFTLDGIQALAPGPNGDRAAARALRAGFELRTALRGVYGPLVVRVGAVDAGTAQSLAEVTPELLGIAKTLAWSAEPQGPALVDAQTHERTRSQFVSRGEVALDAGPPPTGSGHRALDDLAHAVWRERRGRGVIQAFAVGPEDAY